MLLVIVLFYLVLTAACISAARWGEKPEQIAAAAMVMGAVLTRLVGHGLGDADQIRWGVFAVDLLLLSILFGLALNANRIWPIWLAALQCVTVLAHLIHWLEGDRHAWVYAASITVTGYLMPPLVICAAWRVRQRRKRGERAPCWSAF